MPPSMKSILFYHTWTSPSAPGGQPGSQRVPMEEFGSNLREFLLLEYATSLMSHKSLWIVGVSYLDHCPEFGRKYLEHFMENISIESEKKAQKLLHICQERNLVEQAKSICKVMGRRHMQHKRLGAALTWFLKSKDVALSTVIAERFLFEYSEKGSFSNLDLIDNLGPSMLLSNRLTFLGKYREFHKLYEEKEFQAAGQLLLSLLQARLAPKRFWVTLLVDAIPLLEAEEVIFSSSQTFDLMHCLEELMREFKDIDVREKEKLALLRLALTRNLSRAIVKEGTVRLP
ncbi:nuclear pore complex protein Nup85-like [Ylistrum balloti]|uniref:nuclear pore complex protein Nup85-like n=1 Tax=Ylistrum balloti TaxID=509963 RepID=UPI002905A1AC|nr:nuclear pore complex protein Nup85-like [Ylistrum balloti]